MAERGIKVALGLGFDPQCCHGCHADPCEGRGESEGGEGTGSGDFVDAGSASTIRGKYLFD